MKNQNSYSFFFKLRFAFFMFVYGMVKYVPGPIPGDWFRAMTLKMFSKKICTWQIKDGATFWFPWNISIGKNVAIGEYCFLDGNGGIEIGDWSLIAHHCSLVSEDHGFDRYDIPIRFQRKNVAPIVIGRDVWVGCGVRILKGVSIGDGAVIGAGSLVTHNVPPYAVAGGVPATIIKFRHRNNID